MPLAERELLERDAKRNIGEELLAAIRDIKAGYHGATYDTEPDEVVAKHTEVLRKLLMSNGHQVWDKKHSS